MSIKLFSYFQLTGIAKFLNGSIAEKNIGLYIKVDDANDNPPIFKKLSGTVNESSHTGRSFFCFLECVLSHKNYIYTYIYMCVRAGARLVVCMSEILIKL